MNKRHPLHAIHQIRHCAQDMMASLSQLKRSISDEFACELEDLSRNIQQLEQSSNLLRVRVKTRMIERRFNPPGGAPRR